MENNYFEKDVPNSSAKVLPMVPWTIKIGRSASKFAENWKNVLKEPYLEQVRRHTGLAMTLAVALAFVGGLAFAFAPSVVLANSPNPTFDSSRPDAGLSLVWLMVFLGAAIFWRRSAGVGGFGIITLAEGSIALYLATLLLGPWNIVGDGMGFVLAFLLFAWFVKGARGGPVLGSCIIAGITAVTLGWSGNWPEAALFALALLGTMAMTLSYLIAWSLSLAGRIESAPVLTLLLTAAGSLAAVCTGYLAMSFALAVAGVVALAEALTQSK